MDANQMRRYIEEASRNLEMFDLETLEKICCCMSASIAGGGRILVCGNGGSAADASHFAGELIGRFRRDRRALPAIALTVDPAVITAVANDFGFGMVFSRQVEALAREGDVLVAITTSGCSPNVVAAAEEAGRRGVKVVAFTAGGREAPWADLHWRAPSAVTSHAQEAMLVAFHALCEALESALAEE